MPSGKSVLMIASAMGPPLLSKSTMESRSVVDLDVKVGVARVADGGRDELPVRVAVGAGPAVDLEDQLRGVRERDRFVVNEQHRAADRDLAVADSRRTGCGEADDRASEAV